MGGDIAGEVAEEVVDLAGLGVAGEARDEERAELVARRQWLRRVVSTRLRTRAAAAAAAGEEGRRGGGRRRTVRCPAAAAAEAGPSTRSVAAAGCCSRTRPCEAASATAVAVAAAAKEAVTPG